MKTGYTGIIATVVMLLVVSLAVSFAQSTQSSTTRNGISLSSTTNPSTASSKEHKRFDEQPKYFLNTNIQADQISVYGVVVGKKMSFDVLRELNISIKETHEPETTYLAATTEYRLKDGLVVVTALSADDLVEIIQIHPNLAEDWKNDFKERFGKNLVADVEKVFGPCKHIDTFPFLHLTSFNYPEKGIRLDFVDGICTCFSLSEPLHIQFLSNGDPVLGG